MTESTNDRPWTFQIQGRVPLTEEQLEALADILLPHEMNFTYDAMTGDLAVRGHRDIHPGPWGAVAIAVARIGAMAFRGGQTDVRLSVTVQPGQTDEEIEAWLAETFPESGPAAASAA